MFCKASLTTTRLTRELILRVMDSSTVRFTAIPQKTTRYRPDLNESQVYQISADTPKKIPSSIVLIDLFTWFGFVPSHSAPSPTHLHNCPSTHPRPISRARCASLHRVVDSSREGWACESASRGRRRAQSASLARRSPLVPSRSMRRRCVILVVLPDRPLALPGARPCPAEQAPRTARSHPGHPR